MDGCVTENGAVYFVREGAGVRRFDPCSEEERRARRIRLASLVERVREAVPEARLTDDVDARRSDVTWDVGERMKLPEDRIARHRAAHRGRRGALVRRRACTCTRPTTPTTRRAGPCASARASWGEDPGAAITTFAFVGDSGNDAACFSAFRTTFGVSNVRAALGRLSVAPRYVATRPMGEGFAEIAGHVLALRAK